MPAKLTWLLLVLTLVPAIFVHAGSICTEGYWTKESTGLPGSGSIRVQLFKNMKLLVTGSFNGLSSLTTGVKLYGINGAAAQASFPTGVKAGFFEMRFDLSHVSSYDSTFLLNSNNNVTQAMTLVADSIYTSLFSIVITTLQYPTGELTSSTQPCASNLCYTSELSGIRAIPPNYSPATARVQITINSYGEVHLQGEFSQLTGATTSLQIYPGGSGNSNQTEASLSNHTQRAFPVGKYSDTFTESFHLHYDLTFDPGYLSAHNSNAVSASNFFINSLDNGVAYINLQTTAYPEGEVAGYFETCQ